MYAIVSIQIVDIVIILTGMFLIWEIVQRYRRYWIWSIPIFVLLLHALLFRVVFLIDFSVDYFVDSRLYAGWSEALHMQDKLTIVIYSFAVLVKDSPRLRRMAASMNLRSRPIKQNQGRKS